MIIITFLLSLLFIPHVTFAQPLQSPRFQIEDDSIKVDSITSEPQTIEKTDQKSPITDPEFEKTGIRITHGYPFSAQNPTIQGNLSQGTLTFDLNDIHSSTQETLVTYSGLSPSYTVSIEQNHDLKKLSGESIPATTCDQENCTPTFARYWNSAAAIGFGYSMSGNDTTTDFVNENYYRSLMSRSEKAAPVFMKSADAYSSRTSRIKFKLIPSNTTLEGGYENTIFITIMPGY